MPLFKKDKTFADITQTAWYVHASTGNDAGDGSSGAPLKTLAELGRRIPSNCFIRQSITINLTGAFAQSDALDLFPWTMGTAIVRVVGAKTSVTTGTFTAVTALTRTSDTRLQVADTNQTFTSHANKRIRITASGTGSHVGAIAFIAQAVSATVAATTPFTVPSATVTSGGTQITPSIGDTYVIETLASCWIGTIGHQCGTGANASTMVELADLQMTGSAAVGYNSIGGGYTRVTGCNSIDMFYGSNYLDVTASQCSNNVVECGRTAFLGCLMSQSDNYAFGPCTAIMDGDTISQGIALINGFDGAFVQIGYAGAFNSTGDGLYLTRCSTGGSWGNISGDLFYGTANAGYGMNIGAGCKFIYTTKPRCNTGLGAGRETKIGGTGVLYSAVPAAPNASNGAVIAIDA